MLLGMVYFSERPTAHPALVVMRLVAWGGIALSCIMLIYIPFFSDMTESPPGALWWAKNVGLPWIYLPFAGGLLYVGRGRSGWDAVPPPCSQPSLLRSSSCCARKNFRRFLSVLCNACHGSRLSIQPLENTA